MNNVLSIFWQFLQLGCISFGGPAAHVGYFYNTFVKRHQWLTEDEYTHLLSLSQFLPGPGSSQMGFAIGLQRGGLLGGLAAFVGFTLPSFLIMLAVAVFGTQLSGNADKLLAGAIAGLKLLAVVVVADACINMYKKFCSQKLAAAMAVVSAVVLLLFAGFMVQIGVLLAAAILGYMFYKLESMTAETSSSARVNWLPLMAFVVLLVGLPMAAQWLNALPKEVELLSDFYQAGSLVFGGGHVVLPLLQQLLGDAISADRFLFGYASAQAIPGPMFTFATFLGADIFSDQPVLGAVIATIGIFLPGFLLVLALRGAWQNLTAKPAVQGAVWGVNAAVVGFLLAALYQPVFVSAVYEPKHMVLVMLGALALMVFRLPIVALVAGFAIAGMLFL